MTSGLIIQPPYQVPPQPATVQPQTTHMYYPDLQVLLPLATFQPHTSRGSQHIKLFVFPDIALDSTMYSSNYILAPPATL